MSGFIRIVSRPVGEAPPEVRDNWVGLTLPVEFKPDPEFVPEGLISGRLAPEGKGGYYVKWDEAMSILGKVNWEARLWFERNVEECPLIFDKNCCEPVPD